MRRNEGPWDRVIRLVLGIAVLVGAGAIGFSTLGGIIAIAVAAILIGTAAVGSCPLYTLFNFRTNAPPVRDRDQVGAAS